jgi:SH3 domain-containing protein
MPEMRWFLLSLSFLLLFCFVGRSCVEAAPRKATFQGSREVNPGVGPGVDQGIRSVLKENDQLAVQEEQGEWYLVETSAGQKGYVHKNFVKLADEERAAADGAKEPKKLPTTDASAPGGEQPSLPIPAANKVQPASQSAVSGQTASTIRKPDERMTVTAKAPSLIELLEGRETDMMLWAAIAIVFFLIGWICGGHYYLRRDRARRTRLRF